MCKLYSKLRLSKLVHGFKIVVRILFLLLLISECESIIWGRGRAKLEQDALTLLSVQLALLIEGPLKVVRGRGLSCTLEYYRITDKGVSPDGGGATSFLNFSSGSIHFPSDVLHYFKVKF